MSLSVHSESQSLTPITSKNKAVLTGSGQPVVSRECQAREDVTHDVGVGSARSRPCILALESDRLTLKFVKNFSANQIVFRS